MSRETSNASTPGSFACRLLAGLLAIAWVTVAGAQDPEFIRGDCSSDGRFDLVDPFHLFDAFFIPGAFLFCADACDADDNGALTLDDGFLMLTTLFADGAPPLPAPYPECGPDPGGADLGCGQPTCVVEDPPFDPEFTLAISSGVQLVDEEVTLSITLERPGGDPFERVRGFSFGVCHDASIVALESAGVSSVIAAVNDGMGPHYCEIHLEPGAGWTIGVALNIFGTEVLPPLQSVELGLATYRIVELGSTEVAFCDSLGDPEVRTLLQRDSGHFAVVPEQLAGEIQGVDGPLFLRGDADSDGVFNGLIDGIFILSFGFVPGSPVPPCFDAFDADDDGVANSLLDGLHVLNYQFLPGQPPPPAPGPHECGIDPTFDPLDCGKGCP